MVSSLKRRVPALFYGCLIGLALLFAYLSKWQFERRIWKEELIAQNRLMQDLAPEKLTLPIPTEPNPKFYFRRFILVGVFRENSTLFIPANAPKDIEASRPMGFYVFGLFDLNNGPPIALKLGWISQAERGGYALPKGLFSLTAQGMRVPKKPFWETSARFLSPYTLTHENIPMMFHHWQMPGVPYYFQAISGPRTGTLKWPLMTAPIVSLPNNHLAYAITWAALSFLIIVLICWHYFSHGNELYLNKEK